MASTKDRQRALERARYQRIQKIQAQRQLERKKRTRVVALSTVVAILIATGIGTAIALMPDNSKSTPAASSTPTGNPSAAPTATAPATPEPVGYLPNGTAAKNVGTPVFNAAAAAKPYTATITTNRGNVVFTALTTKAPYATFSFEFLAGKGYFNNTPCHRLTTSGLYVLQCGDPTGTGSGGPGYKFQDENLTSLGAVDPSSGTVTYPAGTVAMANSGADTNGSQFFLVYQDSPLPPNYTPFGTITQGLDVLKAIAAKGSDNSNGSGDGKPNESVTITGVTTN